MPETRRPPCYYCQSAECNARLCDELQRWIPPEKAFTIITEVPHLTDREVDVLRAAMYHSGDKAIGQHLGITANTVSNHWRSIMDKMQIHDRTACVVRAIALGLIHL